MNYALGCAFSINDMFMNFKYKKLKLTCRKCKSIIGDNHRDVLVKRIFRKSLNLVINDIIDNNITFWFPLTGKVKCNMHMRRVEGDTFKNLRRGGKWKDVDILKSWFCGYVITLYMLGNRTPRTKSVYLNRLLRDKITNNTNLGMNYGDGKIDKTISDYYSQIQEEFPGVSKSDIITILKFSWKSLYLHNSYGGDTLIFDPSFWCYIGNLKKDPLQHFYYYIRKLTVKLRVLYKRKSIKWDGYYYFALSDPLYELYLKLKNKTGRPKKYFNFNTIYLYLILDECKISEHGKRYIFRIPYVSPMKTKLFIDRLTTDKAELIIEREPLKFKDIIVSDNEYELL